MVLTVEKGLNLVPVVRELMTTKLPIKLAYKVARFARKVDEQLKDFMSQRDALIKEYGVEDKETQSFKVSKERLEDFQKKLGEILPETFEVDVEALKVEELEGVAITPAQVLVLEQNGFLVE